MTDRDPKFDAVVDELQRAGFVTVGKDVDGEEAWTLTGSPYAILPIYQQ